MPTTPQRTKPRGAPTRTDRIILLLHTLNDIREPETSNNDNTGHTKPGSRTLMFSPLYHAGSYPQLERCLDQLRQQAPRIHWHVVRHYVQRNPTSDGNGKAPEGTPLRDRKARLGLAWIDKHMPAFIMVPVDILENAGYTVPRSQREKEAA